MAQMDAENRALAYLLRHPPKEWGVKPLKIRTIAEQYVVNTDGDRPSRSTVGKAVLCFRKPKAKRGRKAGWRKTTQDDDEEILKTFRRLRPPGYAITAPEIHRALPRRVRAKVGCDTIRSRLAEKGYVYDEKLSKTDKGVKWRKRRLEFCSLHAKKTPAQLRKALQGVADFSTFTYFPKTMRARYNRMHSRRTYMSASEKTKPAFMKPVKHMFSRTEYKRSVQMKLFGMTLADGSHLECVVPTPFTSEDWVSLIKRRVGPFVQRRFPGETCKILFDGERLLHTKEAKAALKQYGMRALPGWPPHSPDLNPQENVWPWIDRRLRKDNTLTSVAKLKRGLLRVARGYPAEGLVESVGKRFQECVDAKGAPTRH